MIIINHLGNNQIQLVKINFLKNKKFKMDKMRYHLKIKQLS